MFNAEQEKFVADAMLGKLAKRLRLLGFDVLYDAGTDDNAVLRAALEQNRVLLTRDRGLARRPLAARHLLITSDHAREQVAQVLAAFPMHAAPLSRCSACNTPLQSVEKQSVRDVVPRHVYDEHRDFFSCEGCGRIYWKGSHVGRMIRTGALRKSPAP